MLAMLVLFRIKHSMGHQKQHLRMVIQLKMVYSHFYPGNGYHVAPARVSPILDPYIQISRLLGELRPRLMSSRLR